MAQTQQLTETEARQWCELLNPHLKGQGTMLRVSRRHGRHFVIHAKLPPNGRPEGPVVDAQPPLQRMAQRYGVTPPTTGKPRTIVHQNAAANRAAAAKERKGR